jgi:hypothetical protein
MPVKTKSELKLLFIDGAVPTGQDYTDLIDSMSTADGSVPHGPTHKNGGDDEVASLLPSPYAIPKARSNGTLDPSWLAEFHDDHGNLSGLSNDDHPQYLQKSVAGSVTAVHTFSPISLSAPFLIGANAIGQKVIGLHADKLDTFDAGNASGNIPVSNTTLNVDLNSDMVDGVHFVGSGRTLTVPATGTAALLGEANVFSNMNTFNGQIVSQSILPNLTDTYDLGSSTKLWRKGWLSEMEAILFAKNTISIVGGWMYIAKAEGSLGADVNNSQTTIDFGQTMTNGNFVVFRSSLQVEYMTVGSITTGTTYNVTRNVDGSGANTWPAGSVYVVLGANGDGRIELNSTDTPRISMVKQGATYGAQTEYVRIGDLNGMPTYTTEKWGIFIGDATNYLKYDMTSNTLTIAGNGTGLTAINGGNIQTGTVVASKINVDGTITLTGSGKLVAGTIGGIRTELSASGLVGYSATSTEEVKIDSSTGKLTAGGGKVTVGLNGVNIERSSSAGGGYLTFTSSGVEKGKIGYGVPRTYNGMSLAGDDSLTIEAKHLNVGAADYDVAGSTNVFGKTLTLRGYDVVNLTSDKQVNVGSFRLYTRDYSSIYTGGSVGTPTSYYRVLTLNHSGVYCRRVRLTVWQPDGHDFAAIEFRKTTTGNGMGWTAEVKKGAGYEYQYNIANFRVIDCGVNGTAYIDVNFGSPRTLLSIPYLRVTIEDDGLADVTVPDTLTIAPTAPVGSSTTIFPLHRVIHSWGSSMLTTPAATLKADGSLKLEAVVGTIPLVITSTTMSPNLNADMLDGAHYSEGTWTPVPTACGASPANGIGTYVKIGKKVTATFSIPSNNTSSGTTFTVTGLPFTSANLTNHVWAGVCGYAIDNGVALTGASKWQVTGNSTTVLLYTNMGSGAWTASGVKRAYAVVTYESAT